MNQARFRNIWKLYRLKEEIRYKNWFKPTSNYPKQDVREVVKRAFANPK